MADNSKWKSGIYFLLDTVEYRPESEVVHIRYRNGDIGEASIAVLWGSRLGLPDWRRICVDPDTKGAILVPTLPGNPTIEGETAEIPGDVLRAATDVDYRAYVAKRAAQWSKQIGSELAQLREARGMNRDAVAQAADLDTARLEAIEGGRAEVSITTLVKVLEAMGARLEDLATSKAS